jgi:hypothetical protein
MLMILEVSATDDIRDELRDMVRDHLADEVSFFNLIISVRRSETKRIAGTLEGHIYCGGVQWHP